MAALKTSNSVRKQHLITVLIMAMCMIAGVLAEAPSGGEEKEEGSSIAPPETASQAAVRVLLAFLPNPSVVSLTTFFVLSAMLMSSKFRSKVVTYGGVAGVCVWYAFRRAIKREKATEQRRATIKLSKSPMRGGSISPRKSPLATVPESADKKTK
ncbi:hypothetical protein TeGR_g13649 [Tetraparma gracilis]|uniref:Transmembrane protein n=1 Tax=Tetraparma gracilis TaxID=2962635 RepID=A0ABQ6N7D8_9STRA|nr:hypothetical protein TeGR_g13649 [Tetraparma gracilis]